MLWFIERVCASLMLGTVTRIKYISHLLHIIVNIKLQGHSGNYFHHTEEIDSQVLTI